MKNELLKIISADEILGKDKISVLRFEIISAVEKILWQDENTEFKKRCWVWDLEDIVRSALNGEHWEHFRLLKNITNEDLAYKLAKLLSK